MGNTIELFFFCDLKPDLSSQVIKELQDPYFGLTAFLAYTVGPTTYVFKYDAEERGLIYRIAGSYWALKPENFFKYIHPHVSSYVGAFHGYLLQEPYETPSLIFYGNKRFYVISLDPEKFDQKIKEGIHKEES